MSLLKRILVVLAFTGFAVFAADHQDSPAASADASADITDLYTWMDADASKMNVVLNVHPFAEAGAKFSDSVKYVVNFSSMAGYGQDPTNSQLICVFDAEQQISCQLGSETIDGDASATTGLLSSNEKIKVFAGIRNDPFFFNLTGFNNATNTVHTVAGGLTAADFDANGCPTSLTPEQKGIVSAQLASNSTDGSEDAVDAFAGSNVLSLVFQVDKDLISSADKPIVAVWAATHK